MSSYQEKFTSCGSHSYHVPTVVMACYKTFETIHGQKETRIMSWIVTCG